MNYFRGIYLSLKDLINQVDKNFIGAFILYVNVMGQGKTLSLVRELEFYRKKGYKTYTNFAYVHQEGEISHWKDLLSLSDCVIAIDEISDLFNSHDWQNMPSEVFSFIVNSRKQNVRILATAQEFDDLNKQLRTKISYVCETTKFGRIHKQRYYTRKVFELGLGSKSRKPSWKESFIREDYYYTLYDTNYKIQKWKNLKTNNS